MAKIIKINEVDKKYIHASFDFSGEELRVATNISGEPVWAEVFNTGGDLHKRMGLALVNNDEERYDKSVRKLAKIINFSILYLAQPSSYVGLELSGKALTLAGATKMLKDYKAGAPTLFTWQDKYVKNSLKAGVARTFFGRPRMLKPMINSGNTAQAARYAANHIIQGTSIDLLKIALLKLYKAGIIGTYNGKTRFLNTVHDEVNYSVLYYNDKQMDEILCKIKSLMDFRIPQWKVPVVVDGSYGLSFGLQLELKVNPETKEVKPKYNPEPHYAN